MRKVTKGCFLQAKAFRSTEKNFQTPQNKHIKSPLPKDCGKGGDSHVAALLQGSHPCMFVAQKRRMALLAHIPTRKAKRKSNVTEGVNELQREPRGKVTNSQSQPKLKFIIHWFVLSLATLSLLHRLPSFALPWQPGFFWNRHSQAENAPS